MLQMQALFRIGKGEPPPIPDSLSRDAKDLIQQCLRVNPNDRPTAAELLEHPFVRRPLYAPAGSESPMPGRYWECYLDDILGELFMNCCVEHAAPIFLLPSFSLPFFLFSFSFFWSGGGWAGNGLGSGGRGCNDQIVGFYLDNFSEWLLASLGFLISSRPRCKLGDYIPLFPNLTPKKHFIGERTSSAINPPPAHIQHTDSRTQPTHSPLRLKSGSSWHSIHDISYSSLKNLENSEQLGE